MRKRKDKVSLYESLKTNKIASPSSKGFRTGKIMLPKLENHSPNFFRVGCPTEILIHIPRNVAKLKLESQYNTEKFKGSIKELINENPEKPEDKQRKSSYEMWQEFDSIKVPIKSFAEVKLPTHYFSLESFTNKKDESLSKVMQKISSSELLKPLSSRAQEIKDRFTIKFDLATKNSKSPYFTSPQYFNNTPKYFK